MGRGLISEASATLPPAQIAYEQPLREGGTPSLRRSLIKINMILSTAWTPVWVTDVTLRLIHLCDIGLIPSQVKLLK